MNAASGTLPASGTLDAPFPPAGPRPIMPGPRTGPARPPVTAPRFAPLLFAVLLFVGLAGALTPGGSAFAQNDPFGDPFADPPDVPFAEEPDDGADASLGDPARPDPLAARLAAARAALAAGGVADPLPQTGPLLVTYERATLPSVRDPRRNALRTLAGVLRVQNTGDEPVRLGPGVRLIAGRETLRPNTLTVPLSFGSDAVRGSADEWDGYRTVAPGEVAEFPATFLPLPGGQDRLPDPLLLTVPYLVGGVPAAPEFGGEPEESEEGERFLATLDVAAYHRGLADLHADRLGPRDALATLSVRGELTYLGRSAAIDRLRELAQSGARRGVLLFDNLRRVDPANGDAADGDPADGGAPAAWEPTVPPLPRAAAEPSGRSGFDPSLRTSFGEFASSRGGDGAATRAGFREFAQAPAANEETAAARSALLRSGPMARGKYGPSGDLGAFYDDPADAVAAVLGSALRTLDAAASETLIRSAEPLVRPAAVRFAGPNLPPARVPLLIGLLDDPDRSVRRAAAAALGEFDLDAARAALAARVTDAADPRLAADAAESLAVSRYPAGQRALARALADGLTDGASASDGAGAPPEVFAVLADHPDPAWESTLIDLAGDEAGPSAVRAAALEAVVASGSGAADRLLADAIQSPDAVVAWAAFERLEERPDPAARRLTETFVLRELRRVAGSGEPLDDRGAEYVLSSRPPAALEPLRTLFENGEAGTRAPTIDMLAAVAATSTADAAAVGERLADAWPELGRGERTAALPVVADFAPDRVPPLAGEALKSGDRDFERIANTALVTAKVDGATVDQLLAEAFAVSEEEGSARRLALTLVARATPAARAAALDARWDENPVRREAADFAVDRMTLFGPAQAFFLAAAQRGQIDTDGDDLPDGGPGPHKASLPLLDIALRYDPQLASGWSQRAFSRGQAGELEGARDDYRRALELDPYDNLAMTGLAILEIELGGDMDGGLARAEAGLEKYPGDRLFAYNVACTYGVAAKALRKAIDAGTAGPGAAERFERYKDKAREHLVRSYRLGLDGKEHRHHASTDPDLDALHGDPVFEQVIAGTLPAGEPALKSP